MSAPRFVPKSFAKTPAAFGKHGRIQWVTANDEHPVAHLRASQWQHAYALAIREAVTVTYGGGLAAYARRAQCTYDRLTKVLRGDLVMHSVDIGLAMTLLPDIHPSAIEYLAATLPRSEPSALSEAPLTPDQRAEATRRARDAEIAAWKGLGPDVPRPPTNHPSRPDGTR